MVAAAEKHLTRLVGSRWGSTWLAPRRSIGPRLVIACQHVDLGSRRRHGTPSASSRSPGRSSKWSRRGCSVTARCRPTQPAAVGDRAEPLQPAQGPRRGAHRCVAHERPQGDGARLRRPPMRAARHLRRGDVILVTLQLDFPTGSSCSWPHRPTCRPARRSPSRRQRAQQVMPRSRRWVELQGHPRAHQAHPRVARRAQGRRHADPRTAHRRSAPDLPCAASEGHGRALVSRGALAVENRRRLQRSKARGDDDAEISKSYSNGDRVEALLHDVPLELSVELAGRPCPCVSSPRDWPPAR